MKNIYEEYFYYNIFYISLQTFKNPQWFFLWQFNQLTFISIFEWCVLKCLFNIHSEIAPQNLGMMILLDWQCTKFHTPTLLKWI